MKKPNFVYISLVLLSMFVPFDQIFAASWMDFIPETNSERIYVEKALRGGWRDIAMALCLNDKDLADADNWARMGDVDTAISTMLSELKTKRNKAISGVKIYKMRGDVDCPKQKVNYHELAVVSRNLGFEDVVASLEDLIGSPFNFLKTAKKEISKMSLQEVLEQPAYRVFEVYSKSLTTTNSLVGNIKIRLALIPLLIDSSNESAVFFDWLINKLKLRSSKLLDHNWFYEIQDEKMQKTGYFLHLLQIQKISAVTEGEIISLGNVLSLLSEFLGIEDHIERFPEMAIQNREILRNISL